MINSLHEHTVHVSHIALLLVKEIVSQEKYGFFFTGVIILPFYNELKSSFDISINIQEYIFWFEISINDSFFMNIL